MLEDTILETFRHAVKTNESVVLLVESNDLVRAARVVAATVPRAVRSGLSWTLPQGGVITLASPEDARPKTPYTLVVCPFGNEVRHKVDGWLKHAAKKVSAS